MPVSGSVAGVNLDADTEGTPVDSIVRDNISFDFKVWNVSVSLTEDAIGNNTSVAISTQICVNSGFCHTPATMTLEEIANGTYSGSVTPMDDHTYINWRIILSYEDNTTERLPASGWSKIWSDCWLDLHSEPPLWGGNGCPEEVDDEGFLPSIGVLGTTATLMLAGATYINRKNKD
ncbi:MAG: hypothetical protein CXT69_01590 [Methanobacteriota archaeon]|jgi:hypothetical protein|nr:MAG: hypothetical protein CXT69_01590 [Euryarchaeota archaeon]